MVADGNQTYYGDHFIINTNFKSLWYISETNIMLYVNFASVKMYNISVSGILLSYVHMYTYVYKSYEQKLGKEEIQ